MKDDNCGRENDNSSGLTSRRLLDELVALARDFSVEVRIERGDFETSLCRIKGQTVVYINTSEPVNRVAEVISDALAGQDLDSRFILPEVRVLLEGSGRPAPPVQPVCK